MSYFYTKSLFYVNFLTVNYTKSLTQINEEFLNPINQLTKFAGIYSSSH